MPHPLCLALAMTTLLGCSSLGPSSKNNWDKPGVVDWSCGYFMPAADTSEWALAYHNELFPGRTTISVREVRSLWSARPHTLNLTGCELEEGVIREIAALTTLEDVSLAGTTGDEENIEALSALELQSLDLSGTNVNDGDLAAIAKIRTLRTLKINCTDVSDTGLRCLLGLPAFERLEVSDSAVTDSALDHFEQAEPSVEVVRKFDAAVTGGVY